jgi:hypothetical protein
VDALRYIKSSMLVIITENIVEATTKAGSRLGVKGHVFRESKTNRAENVFTAKVLLGSLACEFASSDSSCSSYKRWY